jgi:putative transposase
MGGLDMKAKRYTEEQIIGILKEHEAGMKVADLVRRHGVSEQSFYRWKSKYGGLEVSDARRLRELERENARLKRLLAEAELDKAMLKDIVGKKW